MKQIKPTEVLEILAAAFEEPLAGLQLDTLKEDIPGWDSMGALVLMAEFDEKLSIELPADECKKMCNVGDVLNFLRARGVLNE